MRILRLIGALGLRGKSQRYRANLRPRTEQRERSSAKVDWPSDDALWQAVKARQAELAKLFEATTIGVREALGRGSCRGRTGLS
jgi:hypothetical protein